MRYVGLLAHMNMQLLHPFTSKLSKNKQHHMNILMNGRIHVISMINNSSAQQLPIEWAHTRVPFTDLKVRITLYSIINSITSKYC